MKKISDTIIKKIIKDISTGSLSNGTQLDETNLAQQFNVSRTPVREALASLIAQGILENKSGSSIWVKTYSKDELEQMLEAMREIEIICAKLASKRLNLLSQSEIIKAQKECKTAAQEGKREEFLKKNEEFHLAIYRATKNKAIYELASNFRYRTGPFRSKSYQTKEDFTNSIKAHEAIVNTILGNEMAESDHSSRERMAAYYIKVLELI